MSETGRGFIYAISLGLIGWGIIGMLAVLVFTGLAASHDGFTYKCLVEGPYPEAHADVILIEAAQPVGRFSLWPLGRACDWERTSGQGYITANPDWVATVTFLSCAASIIFGSALLRAPARRPGAARVGVN